MDQRTSYSPEDNSLRLYVGRVSREEFLKLRAEGWRACPKQREAGGCDFVATWTPSRRDTALEYGAGVIEDEDQPMAERAADRAERFGVYRDKRTNEATGHADTYDAGPSAHGFQSQARAERAAARHDRHADRAGDAWSKAEYWTQRTAGVIANALYKSRPDVRMGRIKILEADIRKAEKRMADYLALIADFKKLQAIADPAEQTAQVIRYVSTRNVHGDYAHPRPETVTNDYIKKEGASLYGLLQMIEDERGTDNITGAEAVAFFFSDHSEHCRESDWTTHLRLRLDYENQMLAEQGGRAAFVEMQVGGWIGDRQIRKVNKSAVTGRVVSVMVRDNKPSPVNHWGNPYPDGIEKFLFHTIETERLPADAYRAPTAEELAAFQAMIKAEKAAAPKVAVPPLINPTDADAERLQALWNDRAKEERRESNIRRYGKDYPDEFKPSTVCRITQAVYSANSKGGMARAKTVEIGHNAQLQPTGYSSKKIPVVCNLRTSYADGFNYGPKRVIILTDKPQKPLPAAVWQSVPAQPELITGEPKKLAGKSHGLSYTVNA